MLTRGEGTYTNKIDNWSLGVILYICLVGYPPFSDENSTVSLEKQIMHGLYDFPDQYWSGISADAIQLVQRLLCLNPEKRATLEEVLEHRWIKNDLEMKRIADDLMNNNRGRVASVGPKRDFQQTEERTSSLSQESNLTSNPRIKRIRK